MGDETSPVFRAIRCERVGVLEEMCDQGMLETIAVRDAVMCAVEEGRAEIVRVLLCWDTYNEVDAAVLCSAIEQENAEIVRLLLEHGIDCDAWDAENVLVAMDAVADDDKRAEIARLLSDYGIEWND